MIELKHLRTIVTLQQTGSITQAAKQLHQTQSALSHQLTALEKRLGFELFIRKTLPIQFTMQGNVLLHLAQQILPQIQQALRDCQAAYSTCLRLAIECHSCIQWLMPTIRYFRRHWPEIELDFQANLIFEPQPALMQGNLDLVITSETTFQDHLVYIPLFDYEVRLALAPQHPLAHKPSIEPQDLVNEILLVYPVIEHKIDILRRFLYPVGIVPVLKKVDNTQLVLQMVSAQMGIAALPYWAVENVEKLGLVITKPLGEGIWSKLYAAIRQEDQQHPLILAFLDAINEQIKTRLISIYNVFVPKKNEAIMQKT